MFEERNLLYFNEYYFENGNPAKPKYFLVLKSDENRIMIISLPSSKDFIPLNVEKSMDVLIFQKSKLDVIFFKIILKSLNVDLVFR